MQNLANIHIRAMIIEDYDEVANLWAHIEGFYIRSVDDSREGVERFLERNPNLSVVAEMVESSSNVAVKSSAKSLDFVAQCHKPSDCNERSIFELKSGLCEPSNEDRINNSSRKQGEALRDFSQKDKTERDLSLKDNAPPKIVGSILCGHDGRYGSIYHACVHRDFRLRGIGKAMVAYALEGFRRENITSIALIAFSENLIGNAFWKTQGWDLRANANRYELSLNMHNIITKIPKSKHC